MKKVALLVVALLVAGTMVMAQGRPGEGRRGGQREMDPKAHAERMTERMVKEYSLNDTQKQQVYEVNLEMAQKMTPPQKDEADKSEKKAKKAEKAKKVDKAVKENRDKRVNDMKKGRDEYNAKLEKIFTKEQYEAYTKKQSERQGRMGERGPRTQQSAN